MNREQLFALYRRHVNAGKIDLYQAYGFDAVMGRRSGIRFWDAFDPTRSWLNCHCNGGVFNLGHRNPVVLKAVEESLGTADIGNHHLPATGRAQLAARLASTTAGRLPGVVFGVSGGEAVDLAIKVARGASGRSGVVSASGGYHGHTGLAVAAGDLTYRQPFGASHPDFSQVPFGDLDALRMALGPDTATVILEPVPATLGMPIPDDDYLPAVQMMCRESGVLLIVDEVQTGLGRTGAVWAYQHWDLDPDLLVTGKGLSGGVYPITATLMKAHLHSVFERHPFSHISTFGGAEPGCAAGLAVMDIVGQPGFLSRVSLLGERFEKAFQALGLEVRRLGMMMAVVFDAPDAGILASKLLFDAGVFAVYANNDTRVLQFLPPLTTTDDEAAEICEIFESVFG